MLKLSHIIFPEITCPEEVIIVEGVGDGTFTFKETTVSNTFTIPCKASDAVDVGMEMVLRYCYFNPVTKDGEWASADYIQCSSEFTQAVKDLETSFNDIDITVRF